MNNERLCDHTLFMRSILVGRVLLEPRTIEGHGFWWGFCPFGDESTSVFWHEGEFHSVFRDDQVTKGRIGFPPRTTTQVKLAENCRSAWTKERLIHNVRKVTVCGDCQDPITSITGKRTLFIAEQKKTKILPQSPCFASGALQVNNGCEETKFDELPLFEATQALWVTANSFDWFCCYFEWPSTL